MSYNIEFPPNYVKPILPGRDEWTAALRSGKYPQSKNELKNEMGYCCLGVLSKIQGRLVYSGELCTWLDKDTEMYLSRDNPAAILGGNGDFPVGVMVRDNRGHLQCNLAHCNDSGFSFGEIAEII